MTLARCLYASEGVTLGLDYKVLPNLVVGACLGYNHVFTSIANDGALDSNGVTGGLYGSWFSHGFYVNGIVGGGYSGFTARRLSIGGFTRGDSDSEILNTSIGGGYDLHKGGWTFGPTVSLEYDEAGMDSFTETGSLAPLHTFDQSQDSLRSSVGGHISYTGHVNGMTVRPGIHASWQHEYDDAAASFGANVAGTNAGFVVQGPNLGRDSALVGAGVTLDLNEQELGLCKLRRPVWPRKPEPEHRERGLPPEVLRLREKQKTIYKQAGFRKGPACFVFYEKENSCDTLDMKFRIRVLWLDV